MRKFLLYLFVFAVLVASSVSFGQSLGQDVYSVELQGFAWNHSTLNALVVTPDNESWWNPVYLNSTIRAIGEWNDAVGGFAENYTDFSYLSNAKINWQVSNETQFGYDIYINWTQSSLSSSADEIGLTKTYVASRSSILNCTVTLAVQTAYGSSLSEVDMQNVAAHELGHCFGLGHSNYTGDLMYSVYTLGSSTEAVSTLDAYGVATLFSWMQSSVDFYPVSEWLTANSVVLPSAITYSDLPVSPQNTPPQTLANNPVVQFFVMILGFLLLPVIGIPLLIVIVVFLLVAFFPRRRRKSVMADS